MTPTLAIVGELRTVVDLLGKPELWSGVLLGLVGAGLLLALAPQVKRSTTGWGLAFVAAVLAASAITRSNVGSSPLVALAVIVAVGVTVDGAYSLPLGRAGPAIKLAAWGLVAATVSFFSVDVVGEPSWSSFGFPVAVVALAAGLWEIGRTSEADLAGPLLAIAVAGAWVTVPETDLLVIVLGVTLPMGLVTLAPIRARASAAGALGLGALFSWVVFEGGLARPWTIAASCAGAALIPLIALILRYEVARPGRILTLVTQFAYVAVVTRIADYTDSTVVVLAGSLVALTAAGLVLVMAPSDSRVDEPVL